jgi:hypothetical protein
MVRGFLPALVLFVLLAAPARAQDAFEIQVYDSEINKPLQLGLEGHINFVAKGRRERAYPEEVPPDHLTHLTLEPSFALTEFWELGAYLQFVAEPTRHFDFAGVKVRSKFVLPAELAGPFDLGVNFELSHVPIRFEEASIGFEVRPILGFRAAGFRFDVNPILSFAFKGTKQGVPDFDPCAKLTWDTTLGFDVGVEYYTGLGKIDHIPAFQEQTHMVFVVANLVDGPLELNVGVGRGLTEASNDWTVKMIIGKALDRKSVV